MIDIEKTHKQMTRWINLTTALGVSVMAFYAVVVVPSLKDIVSAVIFSALVGVGSIIPLIVLHYRMMLRWLKRVDNYLKGEKESGPEVLRILLKYPWYQPFLGFLIWVLGGFIAIMAILIPSGGRFAIADQLTLWLGIILGAVIIWIFQFYRFRVILAPLAQEVVKKDPQIFETTFKQVSKLSLQSSLLITVGLLLVVSLIFAMFAGYNQAAYNLQEWLGKEYLNDVEALSETIKDLDLTQSKDLERARALLASAVSPGEQRILLIDDNNPKIDLLTQTPHRLSPLILNVGRKVSAKSPQRNGYGYNNYDEEVIAFKELRAKTAPKDRKPFYLIIGHPWKEYRPHLHRLVLFSIAMFILFGGLAALVAISVARDISRPVLSLNQATQQVAKGDLKEGVNYISNDELGDLALNFREMGESLKLIIRKINQAVANLEQSMNSIAQASEAVNQGSHAQEQAVEEVFTAMIQMNTAIQGISENVDTLSSSAQESSSSIFEMNASMKRIFESIESLDHSINDTSSSINEMTAAINQVAENVNKLSEIAELTVSSMTQMNQAISQIEKLANETARLSEAVITDAEEGTKAVDLTRQGIHQIAQVVSHAEEVITKLGKRTIEIGKIVQVIEEVASQTNLLALNAAIIAAQAGEQGRGFAVVADEIKQLAERTAGSTREITQVITGVQKEANEAVKAIQEGTQSVGEGVQLSEQARNALDKILESARKSTESIKEIARTTVEQASSSKQISKAMEQVAGMVNQISIATNEQSKGGSLILKATERMKDASKLVRRATEEQVEGARLVSKSIENITDMLYNINTSQKEQKKAVEQVLRQMERIRQISQEAVESASRLDSVFRRLEEEANRLKQEITRFQI